MNVAYMLHMPKLLLTDGSPDGTWLHDMPRDMRIDAMVASGDFCETLAVQLEQIAAGLPENDASQYQLQDIISTLLYAQRHYELAKRAGSHGAHSDNR